MLEAHPSRMHGAVDAGLVAIFFLLVATPWSEFVANGIDLSHILSGPSSLHPLGSDVLGRDLLIRLAAAMRGGVLPLWGGVIAGSFVGLFFGLLAAIGRDRQNRVARIAVIAADGVAGAVASVPVGIAAFAWAATFEGAGIVPVLLTLASLFAVRTYLQIRDLSRHDAGLAYWQAHVALGGSSLARLWRYGVLGGWRRPLIEGLSFHLGVAVAIEASLSYLGFGIQEPAASFGNMMAAHFDLYLKGHWQVLATILGVFAITAAFPSAFGRLAARFWRSEKFVGP